jgi:hypothetical protein
MIRMYLRVLLHRVTPIVREKLLIHQPIRITPECDGAGTIRNDCERLVYFYTPANLTEKLPLPTEQIARSSLKVLSYHSAEIATLKKGDGPALEETIRKRRATFGRTINGNWLGTPSTPDIYRTVVRRKINVIINKGVLVESD